MLAAADPLIPPMPVPRKRVSTALLALWQARGDILPAFSEEAYERQVIALRLPAHRMLIANHPEVVRHVFIARQDNYQRKSWFMEQALAPVVGDSLFINHGEVWAERRAVVAPPLHPARIGGFHPLFVQAAEELAEDLAHAAPGRVDLAAAFAAATARVMMLALFGAPAPREDAAALATAFTAYQAAAESVDLRYMLGLPNWLRGGQSRTARNRAGALRALIARNLAAVAEAPPLLAALRDAQRAEGGAVLQGEALVNEVAMMLLAGSETAANAMTWATYLLAADPTSAAALEAELATLPPGRAPDADQASGLAFTRAVLQEAMRLYPPVAILSRQARAADQIRRWTIRPGDTVMAIPWLLHRHTALWDRPHAFIPARFLPEAARRQPKFTYIPFGLGPRVCAGAAFGMAEMTVFLAVLMRRFRFRVPQGWAPVPHCRLTLRPRDGMPLEVECRGPA